MIDNYQAADRRRARVRLVAMLVLALAAVPSPALSRTAKESDAQRLFRLGQLQFEQGRTQEAITSLRKALKRDSRMAGAHNYLGFIYLQESEPKKAVKEFKRAIRLDPYFTDAHNHLGLAYREMSLYDKALEEFQVALNDKAYRWPEKIHFNIGHLYLSRGMYPEAIRSFEQTLRIDPGYLRGILGLGTAYQKSGRADLAEKEFQKVVSLGPDSPEAAEARQHLDRQVKRKGS